MRLPLLLPIIQLICLISACCSGENVGPALVLPNDVSRPITISGSGGEPVRTTTVYGFLDFTTTIDQTVVVFRPSSASLTSASAADVIQSTTIAATTSSSSTTATSELKSSSVTTLYGGERDVNGTSPSPTTTIRTEADDGKDKAQIIPTPTLNVKQQATSGNTNRVRNVNSASSLADKRRRFLAQVRRQRPVVPSSTSTNDGRHADQEMAETIDTIPSKVKRYHEGVTVVDDPNNHNANRLLVRKLYRRPNHHSEMSNAKNRLLALRNRSGLKTRFNGPVRGRFNQADDFVVDLDVPTTTLPSHSVIPTSTKALFDPTSATIAEYLPIEEEEEDGDAIAAAAASDKLKSQQIKSNVESKLLLQLDGSFSDFPQSSTSVLEGDENTKLAATIPLPALKSAGDPGLTVPIQLSIVTSTFSLTETRLRTSLLPVYDGKSTTFYTLTHSFLVTKTVTTFQTVPPEEFMPYLIPANDSINAINDVLQPEWMNDDDLTVQRKSDVADEVVEEANSPQEKIATAEEEQKQQESGDSAVTAQSTDPLSNFQQPPVNPLLQNLPFLNLLGPAAALGLNPYFPYGLGQLNPQVITTSRPVFQTSVVFTSKLLPIIDGLTTSYHTVKAPASTVTQTSYETYTTQLQQPSPAGGMPPGAHGMPGGGAAGAGGMSTVTNPYTFVTTETQTSTQVFKLMYDGYKTSYRTVSSLTEVTRTVTTYSTTTVPLYTHAPLLPFFG